MAECQPFITDIFFIPISAEKCNDYRKRRCGETPLLEVSRVGLHARSAWVMCRGKNGALQDIVCAIRNNGINDNHSIAYCLLGYLCGYFRFYHPGEYITAFLNNAANDDDILNGSNMAKMYGLKITMPKFGISGN